MPGLLVTSRLQNIYLAINKCITKMEVGCLRHPGASTIGSQLLDRLLTWLANPGNPAMSPHAVRGTGTRHTVKTVERGKEKGWEGNCLGDELSQQNRQKNASCAYARLQSTSMWNSDTCAYMLTPLTTS